MILPSQVTTRTADPKDLALLANLAHFEIYVHRHLDYRPPLDWLGSKPFLVLEQASKLHAALACPPDPPTVSWIRFFAVDSHLSTKFAWDHLWPEALAQITRDHVIKIVAAIPLFSWFESLLRKSSFQKTHSIVMLNWDGPNLPAIPPNPMVVIRPMCPGDLDAVELIDSSSFSLIWQNSPTYLELSMKLSAVATVAEYSGNIVGYQISTSTPLGGHLARLAVTPHYQGIGVGYALLYDLLHRFIQHGARTISVNTQKDNNVSFSLYQKAGFYMTGEEYPIYQLELASN